MSWKRTMRSSYTNQNEGCTPCKEFQQLREDLGAQTAAFANVTNLRLSNLENKWFITHIYNGKVSLINSDNKTILQDIPKWYLVEYLFVKN